MPIHYEIDKVRGWVRITAVGTTVEKEWTDALDAMAQDPDFHARRLLIDVHKHDSVAPSSLMWRVGRMAGPQVANARWAMVISRPVSEGMANMLATLVEKAGVKVKTFRTLEEAETWLGEDG